MFGSGKAGAGAPGQLHSPRSRWAGISAAFVVGMAVVAYFGAPRVTPPAPRPEASASIAQGPTAAAPATSQASRATNTPASVSPGATSGSNLTPPTHGAGRSTSPNSVPSPTLPPAPAVNWASLVGASWQYQLSGAVDTSVVAPMFDIDLFDAADTAINTIANRGAVPVCHFSAGTWQSWRPDADAFSPVVEGNATGQPGERWLDIRNLAVLEPIMNARLDLCRSRGFAAAEPDNVDSYLQNTGFTISAVDQQAYNTYLAGAAHARGLAVALKNDVKQVGALASLFDFAIDENCFALGQCAALTAFTAATKPVFDVEYQGQPTLFCPQAHVLSIGAIYKHKNLDSYRQSC